MELAGIVMIGIGVTTFLNGVWLLLYNNQNKKISDIEKKVDQIFNKIFLKE